MTSQNRLFCIFKEVVSRKASTWSNFAPTWPPWGNKFSPRIRGGGRGLTAKEGGAGPTLPSRTPASAPTATSSTWIKQPWNSRQKRKPGQVDVSFFTKFQQEPRHTGYSLVPRTPNTPALTCPHGKPWSADPTAHRGQRSCKGPALRVHSLLVAETSEELRSL